MRRKWLTWPLKLDLLLRQHWVSPPVRATPRDRRRSLSPGSSTSTSRDAKRAAGMSHMGRSDGASDSDGECHGPNKS